VSQIASGIGDVGWSVGDALRAALSVAMRHLPPLAGERKSKVELRPAIRTSHVANYEIGGGSEIISTCLVRFRLLFLPLRRGAAGNDA